MINSNRNSTRSGLHNLNISTEMELSIFTSAVSAIGGLSIKEKLKDSKYIADIDPLLILYTYYITSICRLYFIRLLIHVHDISCNPD